MRCGRAEDGPSAGEDEVGAPVVETRDVQPAPPRRTPATAGQVPVEGRATGLEVDPLRVEARGQVPVSPPRRHESPSRGFPAELRTPLFVGSIEEEFRDHEGGACALEDEPDLP